MKRHNYQKILHCILWISVALTLPACSSSKKPPVTGDMNMTQIYQQTTQDDLAANMNDSAQDEMAMIRQRMGNGTVPFTDYVGYTRDAQNEVTNLFPALPNPQVPVYITPHLTQAGDDEIPVPAYTTSFFLYDKNYIAMPSEQHS